MIFFEDDDSSLIKGRFCLAKEDHSIIIVELREDPLYPNAVILLLEVELLQSFHVKVTHVFLAGQLYSLGVVDQFRTLIDHINLASPINYDFEDLAK